MIGDRDPEDSYDAGDSVERRIAILTWVTENIEASGDEIRARRRALDVLRALAAIPGRGHQNELDDLADRLHGVLEA